MQVSVRGLAEIAGHEGIVPYRYLDSVKVDTFGVGHTHLSGNPPDPRKMAFGVEHNLDEVVEVFARDIATFERRTNNAIRVDVAQHEFDAATSFDLNTGAISRATWVKSLNAGNRPKATAEIMNWTKPKEITERREKEQKLFRDGVYSHGGKATVYPANRKGRVIWSQGKEVDVIPFAASIRGAANSHKEADEARDRATGAGTGAAGSGAATQLPTDAPGFEIFGFDINLVQIGMVALALALATLTVSFLVARVKARDAAKRKSAEATLVLQQTLST